MDTTEDPTRSAAGDQPESSRWNRRRRHDPPTLRDREPLSTPGSATTGGAVTAGAGAGDAVVAAPADSPRRPATDQGGSPAEAGARAGALSGNAVGWTALLLAVVLTVWLAIYELAAGRVADAELYESISRFVSLILALAAAVLGIVALAQRRGPRWPGLVGLAVGLHAFLVAVFSWIGTLT